VESQGPLLDDGGVGPNFSKQIPFADDLARARRQGDQYVYGACAQLNWGAILQEQSFAHNQPKLAKRQDVC
jgi:hypothetical protein